MWQGLVQEVSLVAKMVLPKLNGICLYFLHSFFFSLPFCLHFTGNIYFIEVLHKIDLLMFKKCILWPEWNFLWANVLYLCVWITLYGEQKHLSWWRKRMNLFNRFIVISFYFGWGWEPKSLDSWCCVALVFVLVHYSWNVAVSLVWGIKAWC